MYRVVSVKINNPNGCRTKYVYTEMCFRSYNLTIRRVFTAHIQVFVFINNHRQTYRLHIDYIDLFEKKVRFDKNTEKKK